MQDAHAFLQNLALVLGAAAITTIVFQKLRQPLVLGYLLAGLILGPHVPIPLVADEGMVHTLSELGVILLMFSLGLEFSLGKLFRVGPKAAIIAVLEVALMLWLGNLTAMLFGWTRLEGLFAGAIVAISSTTIIAKAFDEHGVKGPLRELVFGVLIVEDLFAILLLTTLTTVSKGTGLSAPDLVRTMGGLAGFLGAVLVLGLLFVPRLMRLVSKLHRPETTLVTSIGLCFSMALLAQKFGYSVALGAFLAGSLIAESGEEKEVERLVEPVRDMFAAIFFVSVGMLIDPAIVARHWAAILLLTVVVIVGKVVGVSVGAFATGAGVPMSVRTGMSLAQIGEFSFIIAGVGLTLKATGTFLYPVAVAVSALTTLSTPWLIKASTPVAAFVDRHLPRPLQTFAALYGSWLERFSAPTPSTKTLGSRARRFVVLELLDVALLAAIVIGTSMLLPRLSVSLETASGFAPWVTRALVLVGAFALSVPFCIGLARVVRAFARFLATEALPSPGAGKTDLADAPREALVGALQLVNLLVLGVLLLTITQPFLPSSQGGVVVAVLVLVVALGFWRNATNLDQHVRAGSQAMVEALAASSRRTADPSASLEVSLEPYHAVFPGLGDPERIVIPEGAACAGKTLGELNVRGRTGGVILAIRRGETALVAPRGPETLLAGDILAVAGSHSAVADVRALLASPGDP